MRCTKVSVSINIHVIRRRNAEFRVSELLLAVQESLLSFKSLMVEVDKVLLCHKGELMTCEESKVIKRSRIRFRFF